jgi:hypothetical protein
MMNFAETYFFRLDSAWFCLVFTALASHPEIYKKTLERSPVETFSVSEPIAEPVV